MKKILALTLVLVLSFSLFACKATETATESTEPAATEAAAEAAATEAPAEATAAALAPATAGVCWYNFADTFISSARQTLEDAAAGSDWLTLSSADSAFDVPTQANNVNLFLTQDVDYLLVNNLDTAGVATLIQQAKDAGTTLIFLNTNTPTDEEFALYDNVWFISSLADQSGTIMGNYAAEYWQAHPEADRNGNGMMDYVMLIGFEWHYDSTARRDYAIAAVEGAGITTNKVYEAVCNYSRADAMNTMQSVLTSNSDDIEAVFAANDDMALGAIEAMKAAGWFDDDGPTIPVVSVDATAVGCEALQEGTLLGTALNNPVTLGNLAYRLMFCLQSGLEVNAENLAYDASFKVEGHRIWIDYIPIDATNIADATY
ncbi:MAG: galactose ABC transporter substrate-binding protein [Clostridiaceae bacterium]